MNKKKIIIIAIAILSCILISFIGERSFSKYVSEVRGDATAEIATWYFKVNGETEMIQNIKLASNYNLETIAKDKIAPGTKGNFLITVDCTDAEVGIDYSIKFENETVKPTNLRFQYGENICYNLSELEKNLVFHMNSDEAEKVETFNIQWEWPFETGETEEQKKHNNDIDTQESQTIKNYSFDVVVTGTQMKPQ